MGWQSIGKSFGENDNTGDDLYQIAVCKKSDDLHNILMQTDNGYRTAHESQPGLE